MSNIKSPIIICGYPGGGTSYITKILRHSGMFAGISTDYSEFEAFRNFFERSSLEKLKSIKHSFKHIDHYNYTVNKLKHIIQATHNEEELLKIEQYHPEIGAKPNRLAYIMQCAFIEDIYTEDHLVAKKTQIKLKKVKFDKKSLEKSRKTISPLTARKNHEHKMFQDLVNFLYSLTYNLSFEGYKDVNYNLITNLYQRALNQPYQFKDNIEYLKEGFNDIKDDFFDIFFNDTPKNQIWGWKYPLNSTIIPVLKVLFDDPKFLFISKEHKLNNVPQSKGGKMFQNSSKADRESFTNPPWLDESYNYKTINFEEVLTDWTKMKDMLQWLSLGATTSTGDPKDFNENDFKKLLKITKFEPKNI